MPILLKSTFWNRKRPLALSGPLGFKLCSVRPSVYRDTSGLPRQGGSREQTGVWISYLTSNRIALSYLFQMAGFLEQFI